MLMRLWLQVRSCLLGAWRGTPCCNNSCCSCRGPTRHLEKQVTAGIPTVDGCQPLLSQLRGLLTSSHAQAGLPMGIPATYHFCSSELKYASCLKSCCSYKRLQACLISCRCAAAEHPRVLLLGRPHLCHRGEAGGGGARRLFFHCQRWHGGNLKLCSACTTH